MLGGKSFGSLIKRVAAENSVQSPVLVNNYLDENLDSPTRDTSNPISRPSGLDIKTFNDDSQSSSRLSSARSPRNQINSPRSPRDTLTRRGTILKGKTNLQNGNAHDTSVENSNVYSSTTFSDYSDSETDDELENSNAENAMSSFWGGFSNTIKKINDNSDLFALRARPNFKASDHYKDVMTDLFGNSEYGCTRGYTKLKDKIKGLTSVTGIASKIFARATQEMETTDDEDSDTPIDPKRAEIEEKNKLSEIIGAKRGWKLVKRHVNENIKDENTKESKMNWAFLQHHLHNMSNEERARMDLYERYGLAPVKTEKGAMARRNKMFEEQLRAEALTNLKRENNVLTRQTGNKRERVASARASYNPNWGKTPQRKQLNSRNMDRQKMTKRPASETVLKHRLSTPAIQLNARLSR